MGYHDSRVNNYYRDCNIRGNKNIHPLRGLHRYRDGNYGRGLASVQGYMPENKVFFSIICCWKEQ